MHTNKKANARATSATPDYEYLHSVTCSEMGLQTLRSIFSSMIYYFRQPGVERGPEMQHLAYLGEVIAETMAQNYQPAALPVFRMPGMNIEGDAAALFDAAHQLLLAHASGNAKAAAQQLCPILAETKQGAYAIRVELVELTPAAAKNKG